MVDRGATTAFFERLGITDVPETFQLLDQAPASREPFLNDGRWIILVAAVWSGQDRMVIPRASRLAAIFREDFNFAVRFFDYYEELRAWCPSARASRLESGATPIWLALYDGALVSERVGPLTDEFVRRWFVEAFDPVPPQRDHGQGGGIGSFLRSLFRLE